MSNQVKSEINPETLEGLKESLDCNLVFLMRLSKRLDDLLEENDQSQTVDDDTDEDELNNSEDHIINTIKGFILSSGNFDHVPYEKIREEIQTMIAFIKAKDLLHSRIDCKMGDNLCRRIIDKIFDGYDYISVEDTLAEVQNTISRLEKLESISKEKSTS